MQTAMLSGRDARIDFLRGMGILMLAVDHLSYLIQLQDGHQRSIRFYTFHDFGYSSAAEFFVFFSGYVIASAYGKTYDRHGYWMVQARGLHRAWQLHAYNALTLLLTVAMAWVIFAPMPQLFEITDLDPIRANGLQALFDFATLQYAPQYFEILQLYIVLIALCPLVLLLERHWSMLALGASFALWLAVQFRPDWNLQQREHGWYFNPLGWQLLFVLGMWMSRNAPLDRLRVAKRPRAIAILGGLFVLCFLLKAVEKYQIAVPLLGTLAMPGRLKNNLGAAHVLHFFLSLYLFMLLLPAGDRMSRWLATRAVMRVGQQSAECFCLSIAAVYACFAGYVAFGDTTAAYLLGGAGMLLLLLLGAYAFETIKSQPWRKPPGPARPATATAAAPGGAATPHREHMTTG